MQGGAERGEGLAQGWAEACDLQDANERERPVHLSEKERGTIVEGYDAVGRSRTTALLAALAQPINARDVDYNWQSEGGGGGRASGV